MTAVIIPGLWLSQSLISEWTRCKYRFRLRVVDRLEPRFSPAPLRTGTLVHKGMEAALLEHFTNAGASAETIINAGVDAVGKLQAEWLAQPHIEPHLTDELREVAQDLCSVAAQIFERGFKNLGVLQGKLRTVADAEGKPFIEYPMRIPFEGFEGFQGTLDWVCEDVATGHVWLVDFKCRKAIQPETYDEAQIQAPVYQYLLMTKQGLQLNGTATYQMRRAVPEVPEMNKTKRKGESEPGMSRSKSIATTWEVYRMALIENGLDPDDYLDMKEHFKPFDRFDTTYRTFAEVKTLWETCERHGMDILLAAHQALSAAYPRHMNPFNCNRCEYKSYCLAELRGHDTDFLSKTEYMREGDVPFFPIIIEDEES